MKELIIFIFLTLLFIILSLLFFSTYPIRMVDCSTIQDHGYAWHERINLIFNSYYTWRTSPALDFLSFLLSTVTFGVISSFTLSCLTIFFSGLFALFSRKNKSAQSIYWNFCISALATTAITLTTQADETLLQSIAFIPWVLLFSDQLINKDDFSPLLLSVYILFLLLFVSAAGQLSVLYALFLSAYFLYKYDSKEGITKRAYLIIFAPLIFGLVYSLSIPIPQFPEYPHLARVVPDDNLPGNIVPLIGSFPPIPIINRQALKSYYFWPCAVVFLFTVLLFFNNILRKDPLKLSASLPLLLAFFCFLDANFNESVSSIAPLSALSRVFPGLFFFSSLPPAFIITIIFFTHLSSKSASGRIICLFFLIVHISLNTFNAQTIEPSLQPFNELNEKLTNKEVSTAEYNKFSNILLSPSYSVIAERGLNILFSDSISRQQVRLKELEFIKSSHNSNIQELRNIFDNKLMSRWSSKRAAQKGDEWILFALSKSKLIKGVYLSSGKFPADFARGVEIIVAANCDNGELPQEEDSISLYKNSDWQGIIKYTSAGFPYYGSQSEFEIIFNKPVEIKCMKIKQISRNKHFEWSVASLQFIH